jgi:pimeloyl-ACP methyl ester carboxylesterase
MRRAVTASVLIGLVIAALAPMAKAEIIEEPWSAGGLHGTIARPHNHTHGPAVLIVAGSGATDRNGNGPAISTDTYKLLAAGLAEQGILSLRYDKRGVAESRKLVTREEELTFGTFVGDAVAAVQNLSARPDVSSVLIAGHSEGGMIALAAASRVPVAGLILLTTPGRPFLSMLRGQLKGRLPPDLEAKANAIMDALAAGKTVDDTPPELAALFRPSVQPFLMSLARFDAAAALALWKGPVLIVHAGRDRQVSVEDFDALRTARGDAQTLVMPEANHVLKTAPADIAGNLALYRNPAAPLDPALVPAIVSFIRKAAR